MIELYVRAELPETCYIHEAAQWVALGNVPTFYHHDKGKDVRGFVDEHLDHLSAVVEPDYFGVAPFISTFIPEVSNREFSDAIALTGGQSVRDISDRIEWIETHTASIQAFKADSPSLLRLEQEYNEEISALHKALPAAKWLAPLLKELNRIVEIGQAKVFCALAEGRIEARGIRVRTEGEIENDGKDNRWVTGEMLTIPINSWRLSSIRWRDANLALDDDEYGWIGVQVSTNDLFSIFPQPHVKETQTSARLAGAALILESVDGKGVSQVKRGQGRQRKGDGLVEKAVRNEFMGRLRSGTLPDKAEAVCQEVIDWSRKVLEVDVSRSTAQRYLAPVFSARKACP